MQTLQQVSAAKAGGVNEVAEQIVQACPPGHHVSQPLSLLLLEKLPLHLHRHTLSTPLSELCCTLHPAVLPALLTPPPPSDTDAKDPLAQALQNQLQFIAARHAFATLAPARAASANPITSLAS